MGYAISIGSGLAVGLSLLIWALVERGKRAKAEKEAMRLHAEVRDAKRLHQEAAAVHNLREKDTARKAQRLCDENVKLNRVINEMRDRLVKSNDPEAIDSWLDDELSRQP